MDPNLEREQRHVVINTPGQQREVVSDRTVRVDESEGPSAGDDWHHRGSGNPGDRRHCLFGHQSKRE